MRRPASGARLRAALVVGELAVALVLLAASGLLVKTFLRISAPDAVDRRGLMTAQLEFLDAKYADSTRVLAAADRLLERVSSIRSHEASALSRTAFLAGFGAQDQRARIEGGAEVPTGVSPRFAFAITPEYFRTMRMELAAGRPFAPTDHAGTERVVILDDRVARALWPAGTALGRRIKLTDTPDAPWLMVVGVTRAVVPSTTGPRARGTAYVPLAQLPGRPLTLHLRATTERPLLLAPALRAAVAQADPDLPVIDFMSAEDAHARNYWPFKLYAMVMGGFASLAVLLAVIGVYGIVAYGAAQRTREIGIRVALGARRSDVIRLVTGQGFRLALAGIGIGLVLSAGALRVMESLLFGASPLDPFVLLGVVCLIGASASLASYLPARRAARVDPASALRFE